MCFSQYFDILGVAETHLIQDSTLDLDGYRWFGFNRQNIHCRARLGSGGVGFLVKNEMLNCFNVSVLEQPCEGIMWLKMQHKYENFTLLPCVCYLPPENSSRYFDVNTFYEQLLMDIFKYQNDGLVFICGDFNSRCGSLHDYISGVDVLPERNTVDFTINSYGELFIDFLINTNLCILNGRNSVKNDFTSISVKGCSVVDYCITPYDSLNYFTEFTVTRTTDLINKAYALSVLAPSSIPDHSLLSWNIVFNVRIGVM